MKTKADVSLLLASHCQNFFNVITSADLVFEKDVYQRLNEAWQIITDKIYPYLKEITFQASPETLPVEILILIKYKIREAPINQYIDRLFTLEAEVSSIIQEKLSIQNI